MIERRYMTYMTEERLLHTYTVMYTLKLARIHQPDLTTDQVALPLFARCAKPLSASAAEIDGKIPEICTFQIWHRPGAVLTNGYLIAPTRLYLTPYIGIAR